MSALSPQLPTNHSESAGNEHIPAAVALHVDAIDALMCSTRAATNHRPATETNAMTSAPEPTAAETYAARRNDIARLLDVLDMELERNDRRAKDQPDNWALVGNISQVRSDLTNMVAFISNMDRAEVERFLSDAT